VSWLIQPIHELTRTERHERKRRLNEKKKVLFLTKRKKCMIDKTLFTSLK